MRFVSPLIETRLVKRYKRFLADVELDTGERITVHCPNPGSMLGLTEPGIRAWISDSQNPKRKLRYTLEMVETDGVMVGVNTNHPNHIAREAIESGKIPELAEFDRLRTEVRYGQNSRIDILLESQGKPDTYVEVKNVHFVRTPGIYEFPDSVTTRGAKHLHELAAQVKNGDRAVMLYVIQRNDGERMKFAEDLDPGYVDAFIQAHANGVEAIALRCNVTPQSIDATDIIPIDIPRHLSPGVR
ncbi:MAG: DNA/RNA nuclease SfsA [Pseudomonadota bacterium]